MEKITIEYDELIGETSRAYQLKWEDIPEGIWFPKSQVEVNIHEGKVTMPTWLYDKNIAPYD